MHMGAAWIWRDVLKFAARKTVSCVCVPVPLHHLCGGGCAVARECSLGVDSVLDAALAWTFECSLACVQLWLRCNLGVTFGSHMGAACCGGGLKALLWC